MRLRLVSAAALLCGLLGGPAAYAQDLSQMFQPGSFFDVVDEVRIGGGLHQVYSGLFPVIADRFDFTRPEVISFDVLFKSPSLDAFTWIGSPRPEIGATVSLTGYESIAHLALTWQAYIADTPLFVQGTLGGALNNGYRTGAPAGYVNLGCNYGFYESIGIGADLPGNLTWTLTYEHTSNLQLCKPNDGLSNLKFQMGMKF